MKDSQHRIPQRAKSDRLAAHADAITLPRRAREEGLDHLADRLVSPVRLLDWLIELLDAAAVKRSRIKPSAE